MDKELVALVPTKRQPGESKREWSTRIANQFFEGLRRHYEIHGNLKQPRPEWVRDVMRHTGITYYHKLINDKNQVASWAGNSPQIIDSNYRAVEGVTAGTCKKFWEILPNY